jgi:hypothetical protein
LATAAPTIREKFLGVWRLVSCESTDKASGQVRRPFGAKPVGRITYDDAGRMSAQLMDPGRKVVGGAASRGSSAALRDASVEDMRAVLTGFVAYFGTFDIDEPRREVVHHVRACLIPSWVGQDLRRSYEFRADGRLVLTAAGDQAVTRLVWERDA